MLMEVKIFVKCWVSKVAAMSRHSFEPDLQLSERTVTYLGLVWQATEERDEALNAAQREWHLAELLRQELAGVWQLFVVLSCSNLCPHL